MKHNGTHATSKENDLPFPVWYTGSPLYNEFANFILLRVSPTRRGFWSRPRGSIFSIFKHVYTLMKDLSSQGI